MLNDARWQQHRVAALHLQPLLKWVHKEGAAGHERSAMNAYPAYPAYPAMRCANGRDIDNSPRLAALLRRLGMSADIVEASVRRTDATITRAAATIAEWMTYLPEDCVKAMVNDGWHWSV